MKVLAIILAALFLSGCNIPYSDGERAGTVTKFSNKGLFCKTWEGELLMGGMKTVHGDNGDSVVANTFAFTVSDDRVVKMVQDALSSGGRVKMSYHQVALPSPCSSDTGYFINGVTRE